MRSQSFATLAYTNRDVTKHFLTADEANELLLGWIGSGEMKMQVRDIGRYIDLCCGYTMSDFLYGWHRFCFTYNSTGYIKVCV